jgi:hypothetical protein
MSLKDDLLGDIGEIFAGDEIATTATVTPAGTGAAWSLRGVLRSPYRPERMGVLEVGSQNHSFICTTSDRAALKRGDTLTIDGANYRHIEPQDGNPTPGMSTLQLAPL